MVKIPTVEDLTGTQINVTPGAKPNFLLPVNAMTEPYVQMANAAQNTSNALIEYGTSLQDAKNKTLLNNAVLGVKNELQNFEQELYRGQIQGDGSIVPYDPLLFNSLITNKKDSLIQKYVTNNPDIKGLLSNQIKSSIELEFLQISDAVNKEANSRIDSEHIISTYQIIDAYKSELINGVMTLDENGVNALWTSIEIKLAEIQHKVPTATFQNYIDEIKFDVAKGQFLNFTKGFDVPSLTALINNTDIDFSTIANATVAENMKALNQTNPEMVREIFDAAIKQQTDEINLINKHDNHIEKKEKKEENKLLKQIFLNDDEGDEADSARQVALENLKKLGVVDYKTIELAENYLSDENVFADTTTESVYFELKTNIELGIASFDDIITAAPNLTKETFQELMTLQSGEVSNLKSDFAGSILNKYGILTDNIDKDDSIHKIVSIAAARANAEWNEWLLQPENKKKVGSAEALEYREQIFEKADKRIKTKITEEVRFFLQNVLRKQYEKTGGQLPAWIDPNDLTATLKALKDENNYKDLNAKQVLILSNVLTEYRSYLEMLGIE
tara:strand:+ start:16138 stop:17817 length:1680 start_codon:yes stop_codon:yes gene_type:complete